MIACNFDCIYSIECYIAIYCNLVSYLTGLFTSIVNVSISHNFRWRVILYPLICFILVNLERSFKITLEIFERNVLYLENCLV